MRLVNALRWVPIVLAVAFCLADVGQRAHADSLSLTIGSSTLTFPSANPGTTPSISALENPLHLNVSYSGLGTWAVTIIAGGSLVSGVNTIPLSSISFTGTGFSNTSGSLSLVPLTLGVGVLTTTPAQGTLSFSFANSWTYPVGTYTTSIIITAVSV